MSTPPLAVENLSVRFPGPAGAVRAVEGLSYTVAAGETLGIVGESGCGKTASVLAVLGLHGKAAQVSGSVRVGGTEVVGAPERVLRRIRGRRAAMVFQDPLSALHPFQPVGRQIAEAYRAHHDVPRSVARAKAVESLDRVGIPAARRRAADYPHQLSGGMRQRAMIAMAVVNDPVLLLADEPTTALDVTVQAQMLDLLQELQREVGTALVMVTHDLGVVAEVADTVLVMYAGRAVEKGTSRDVLTRPEMPYTRALLGGLPDLTTDPDRPLTPIPGSPPRLSDLPSGCPFHPRCPHVADVPDDLCATVLPDLVSASGGGHSRRCHLPEAVTLSGRPAR
jgi:peptide/nickel transport system ATP-binding protein